MTKKIILLLSAITPMLSLAIPHIQITTHKTAIQESVINQTNVINETNSIINSSTGKVNYVTLGNSLSAGFTNVNAKQYNYIDYQASDHATTTHQIYGDAYSAWVARALQKDNLLGSYDNFAVASQTTGQVIHQLDPSYPQNSDDQAHYNTFTDNGKFDAWVSKTDWNNYYNNTTVVRNAIKKANFINLSLGGNDIIYLCQLFGISTQQLKSLSFATIIKLVDNMYNDKFNINKAVSYNKSDMAKAVTHLKNNISYLIKTIHRLNPNAKIMLMGYFVPLTQLRQILDLAQPTDGNPMFEDILNVLNSSIKSATLPYNYVDYVASDDYSLHTINKFNINMVTPKGHNLSLNNYNSGSWFAPIFSDVHPGPYGYRDMASNIFAALNGQNKNRNNTDPNQPLKDDSQKRLPLLKNDLQTIKNLRNVTFNLATFPISKPNHTTVAYLQPQIAARDFATPTKATSFVSVLKNTSIDYALSNISNILWTKRSNVARLANSHINSYDSRKMIAFKQRWQNIAPRNVGITELRQYAKT